MKKIQTRYAYRRIGTRRAFEIYCQATGTTIQEVKGRTLYEAMCHASTKVFELEYNSSCGSRDS